MKDRFRLMVPWQPVINTYKKDLHPLMIMSWEGKESDRIEKGGEKKEIKTEIRVFFVSLSGSYLYLIRQ